MFEKKTTREDVLYAWDSDRYNLLYDGHYILSLKEGEEGFSIETDTQQKFFVKAEQIEIENLDDTRRKEAEALAAEEETGCKPQPRIIEVSLKMLVDCPNGHRMHFGTPDTLMSVKIYANQVCCLEKSCEYYRATFEIEWPKIKGVEVVSE
jgi:hypothetical protein